MRIARLEPGEAERVIAAGLGLARLGDGTGYYLVAWYESEPVGHAHIALTEPPELQDVEVLHGTPAPRCGDRADPRRREGGRGSAATTA